MNFTRNSRRLLLENIQTKTKFLAKLFCSFFGIRGLGLAGYCSLDNLKALNRSEHNTEFAHHRFVYSLLIFATFATLETTRRPEPKYVPQLFEGWYWGRAGQLLANCFPPLLTVPEVPRSKS